MKIYYYLVKIEDLVYDMVRLSHYSLSDFKETLLLKDTQPVVDKLRCITDKNDLRQHYYVLKFTYNFSTPMQGYTIYSNEEIKTLLQEVRWEHNDL